MADDPRDETVRAQLEVDPLDEIARRRLVSTAVRSARPSRRGWWVAAAAVLVVAAVALGALLVAGPSDNGREAATPVRTPAAEQPQSATGAPASPSAPSESAEAAGRADAAQAGGSVPDVGDFGELSDPANLARLRAALTTDATGNFSTAVPNGRAVGADLATRSCVAALPRGAVAAVATGTLEGQPAIVVLTDTPDGDRSIDAVLDHPCSVRPLS